LVPSNFPIELGGEELVTKVEWIKDQVTSVLNTFAKTGFKFAFEFSDYFWKIDFAVPRQTKRSNIEIRMFFDKTNQQIFIEANRMNGDNELFYMVYRAIKKHFGFGDVDNFVGLTEESIDKKNFEQQIQLCIEIAEVAKHSWEMNETVVSILCSLVFNDCDPKLFLEPRIWNVLVELFCFSSKDVSSSILLYIGSIFEKLSETPAVCKAITDSCIFSSLFFFSWNIKDGLRSLHARRSFVCTGMNLCIHIPRRVIETLDRSILIEAIEYRKKTTDPIIKKYLVEVYNHILACAIKKTF
jgi:hypothetical protein